MRWDIGQQGTHLGALVTVAVPKNHVSELMQNELLSVQNRVTVGVEDQILSISSQPDGANTIMVAKFSKLNDPQLPLSALPHSVEQCVESEDSAQSKISDSRSHSQFDIHALLTLLRAHLPALFRTGAPSLLDCVCHFFI
jgi:hypothetical protein